jgi:protein TonB
MSHALLLQENDTSNDLGITLVGAALLHVLVILGINFTLPKTVTPEASPELEITLVQTHSKEQPDQADFLANASQEGGGSSDKPLRASSPLPAPTRTQEAVRKPPPSLKMSSPQRETVTAKPQQVLQSKDKKAATLDLRTEPEKQKLVDRTTEAGLPEKLDLDLERERLLAEITREHQTYQKRPRRKFLTARTREYKYAAYMDAWRAKVERIGNLNYPEEAKRRNLTGSLVLDVAIRPDGKIDGINIIRSSKHKALDDAAIRIVKLAAPYAPFPKKIHNEVDILHITRTWKFQHGAKLTSH